MRVINKIALIGLDQKRNIKNDYSLFGAILAVSLAALRQAGIICMEGKTEGLLKEMTYEWKRPLPENMTIYSAIKEANDSLKVKKRPFTINELITAMYTDNRNGRFIEAVLEDLTAEGAARRVERERKLFKQFGPIINYEADAASVDRIVQQLRAEFLEPGKLDDETIILASVLAKQRLLNYYFSKYEKETVVDRLKTLKEDSRYEDISGVLTEIENYYTMIYSIITVFIAVS
jgi:hypothetical protein